MQHAIDRHLDSGFEEDGDLTDIMTHRYGYLKNEIAPMLKCVMWDMVEVGGNVSWLVINGSRDGRVKLNDLDFGIPVVGRNCCLCNSGLNG